MIPKMVLLCCLPIAVAACQSGTGSVQVHVPEPVGLDQVSSIAGISGLAREFDATSPTSGSSAPAQPCRTISDQGVMFGDTWTAFRSVTDSGDVAVASRAPQVMAVPTMIAITQSIAVYPDPRHAREVFDTRISDLEQCVALNIPFYGGRLERPDPETAVLSNDGYTVIFALRSSVLIDVSSAGLPDNQRVVSDISRAILDRIV